MEIITQKAIMLMLAASQARAKLSMPVITKILYLTDWKCAIELGRTFTGLRWFLAEYGPEVEDYEILEFLSSRRFARRQEQASSGEQSHYKLKRPVQISVKDMDPDFIRILTFAMKTAAEKGAEDLDLLVMSTYPVITTDIYGKLDLVKKAKEYRPIRDNNLAQAG